MKVIVCHNFYQRPGGEDQVFADETSLLEQHGHDVIRFTVHNDTIEQTGRAALVGRTVWNRSVHAELAELVDREKASIVHFHNTFPLISPAAYYAARSRGAAVVQTLHNYRLFCPAGVLYRDGKVCEECLGKGLAWPAVQHGCYRGSRPATAVTAGMLMIHRAMGSWHNSVDAYVALSQFARDKCIEGGLPPARVFVKPNFVNGDPVVGRGDGGYAVFVGRLESEKGVQTLLDAWKQLNGVRLKIVGHGPMSGNVQRAVEAAGGGNIEWLGRVPQPKVHEAIGRAMFLVMPSLWYEGFPKTLLEAFASGTPVLASKIGSLIELIDSGKTGLHFETGNADDLAAKARLLMGDPLGMLCMRQNARQEFEAKYTASQNYEQLREIYDIALANHAGRVHERRVVPLDVLPSFSGLSPMAAPMPAMVDEDDEQPMAAAFNRE